MKVQIKINKDNHSLVLAILDEYGYKSHYEYEGDCTIVTKPIPLNDKDEHPYFCKLLNHLEESHMDFLVKTSW